MYEVIRTPRDAAEAYIGAFASLAKHVLTLAPPARVKARGEDIVLKFTGLGERYRHHVYVEVKPAEGGLLFTATPPYPMYLLAATLPLTPTMHPSLVARSGHNVVALMTPDYEKAVTALAEALTRQPLLEPLDFTEESGASFIGFLHMTPAGLVAFTDEKQHLPYVDYIWEHEEEKQSSPDILYPQELRELLTPPAEREKRTWRKG